MLSSMDTEVDPTLQMIASVLGPAGRERLNCTTAGTCLHMQAATHTSTCCRVGSHTGN